MNPSFLRGDAPTPLVEDTIGATSSAPSSSSATELQTWRHLNFSLRCPDRAGAAVGCSEHGVRQMQVPWARQRSDFTLLFETLVMGLARPGLRVGVLRPGPNERRACS